MPESFAEVLGRYVQRSHYSAGQVAALSQVPKRTVVNWLSGTVAKPQRWQSIVQVAAALKLNEQETSNLLLVAQHKPIPELRQIISSGRDQRLLAVWPESRSAPFQAIADLRHFVGREAALRELEQLLLSGQRVAVYALHGMGGVGKTSLAAHLAYRLRYHFVDGVLWARLDTMDTMTILSVFAEALGKDVSSFHDVAGRATVVRNLLADKRVLMVLDNAESSEQVRPLLPPTTGKTAVLLTTRHDLAIMDNMKRYPLRSFDPEQDESGQLFAQFLGKNYVVENQRSLRTIADLLGHLPLAVAIFAGRLAANSDLSPDALLAELHQNERRLDALIREDRNVRLSFDLSYEALPAEKQTFFAALGTFGGDDFAATAVTHVTNVAPETAQAILTEFVGLSLVQQVHNGRYRLHPLLREYAREKINEQTPYYRMTTYYIELVDKVDRLVLKGEISNLLAAVDSAYALQQEMLFIQAVLSLHNYLMEQGLLEKQQSYLESALQLTKKQEDGVQTIAILRHLASLKSTRGLMNEAKTHFEEALYAIPSLNEAGMERDRLHCELLAGLGVLMSYFEDHERAQTYYSESLVIAQKIRYDTIIVKNLGNLGRHAGSMGEHEKALQFYQEALARVRAGEAFPETYESILLQNIGDTYIETGHYELAEQYLQEAFEHSESIGYVNIGILATLGECAFAQGKVEQGQSLFVKAIATARETGHLRDVCELKGIQGNRERIAGNYEAAQVCLEESLTLASDLKIVGLLCRHLHFWALLQMSVGNLDAAVTAWERILKEANEIENPYYTLAAYEGLASIAKEKQDESMGHKYRKAYQGLWNALTAHQQNHYTAWLKA